MWKKASPTNKDADSKLKLPTEEVSASRESFCNLTNFTYDKLSPSPPHNAMMSREKPMLGSEAGSIEYLEMGTLGRGNSISEDLSPFNDGN